MFVNYVDPTLKFSDSKSRSEIVDHCGKISEVYKFPFITSEDGTREKIGKLHVDENSGNASEAVSSFIADGWLKCPINTFIQSYSRHNDKVLVYQFERLFGRTYCRLLDPRILGVFHHSPFLHFRGALLLDGEAANEKDRQFSLDAMNLMSYFSKSEGALVFRGADWPSYSKLGEILIFNETPTVVKGLGSERNCRELFSGNR